LSAKRSRLARAARNRGLGPVDGFDEDERKSNSDEGAVVLGRLLAAERNALEALELSNQLLDAGTRSVEGFWEEQWPVPGCGPERDHRTDAPIARCGAIGLGIIALVSHSSTGRDVGPKIEQDFELRAVARLTLCEMEGERQAVPIHLEVDLGRKAPARAAQSLTGLPPFAPAAETWARTTVESNI
ncbi:MAG: hypothetical protein M3441_28940, partial [Chloroflexota bacterium]|nr:hypothetical protein [Chloroflexota bacterium]